MSNPGIAGLEAWWEFNDDVTDSHASNNLTANGGPSFVAAIQGNGIDLELSSSQWAHILDNASISTGDIDWSLWGWVKHESLGAGAQYMFGKWTNVNGEREYLLGFAGTGVDRFRFTIYNAAGASVGQVDADNLGAVSTATDYFVMAWHDATANKVFIQVNNGTVDEAATSGVPVDGPTRLGIGAIYNGGAPANFVDGVQDEFGFAKRIYTASERSWFWNGGNGRKYSDLFGVTQFSQAIIIG